MYSILQYNINGTVFAAILLVLFISDMATIIFDKFGALPKGTLPTKWAFIIEQSDFSTELFIFTKRVAAAAIEKAGSLDRAAIQDALAATDMITEMGQVKFGQNNTRLNAIRPVIQWQNGSTELAWPDNQKSKAFVYPIPGSK